MNDPDLSAFVTALRVTHPLHPHVHPTPEEAEVADVIAELDEIHVRDREMCSGCAETWPCKARRYAEDMALVWVGRAQDRYWRHATEVMNGLDARERERNRVRYGTVSTPESERTTDPGPLPRPQLSVVPFDAVTDPSSPNGRTTLRELRDVPATPAYCRHPACRTVLSIPHPLQPGYLRDAVCKAHEHTTADRYFHDWGFCAAPHPETGSLCIHVTCNGGHETTEGDAWTAAVTEESA